VDEGAFSTNAFSTDAWAFFGAVVAAVIDILTHFRRRNRR